MKPPDYQARAEFVAKGSDLRKFIPHDALWRWILVNMRDLRTTDAERALRAVEESIAAAAGRKQIRRVE